MAKDGSSDGSDPASEKVHVRKKASIERRIALVEEILARFERASYKTEADAVDTAIALENLQHGKHFLLQVISRLEKSNPREASLLVHSLEFITHGIFLGLSRSAISESSLRYAAVARAEEARSKNKQSPREIMIDSAIEEALRNHGHLAGKPFKIAGMIERRLNDALQANSHKTISPDALGKRIDRKTTS